MPPWVDRFWSLLEDIIEVLVVVCPDEAADYEARAYEAFESLLTGVHDDGSVAPPLNLCELNLAYKLICEEVFVCRI